ncbi:phosphotransferase [Kitasatospora sp. NPDC094016]|uniref:phosphotransferase n=1 Tax=Kitasatospora sp. NPDC094016 TaxID=3154986 RepID=UPI0033178E3E
MPLAKGGPGATYPFAWSVYGWIDGTPATFESVVDPIRFAESLADFVAALQSIDASEGPRPGKHNWFRGATLRTYEAQALGALDGLRGHIDVAPAHELWTQALEAQWDGTDVWFHGDLAKGNLLLEDGQLAAVIDFGRCGVGGPRLRPRDRVDLALGRRPRLVPEAAGRRRCDLGARTRLGAVEDARLMRQQPGRGRR